jgi:uncharacterized membrane protein YczE
MREIILVAELTVATARLVAAAIEFAINVVLVAIATAVYLALDS